MHRRTYERLKSRLLSLEGILSRRVRSRQPDYPSLVAYLNWVIGNRFRREGVTRSRPVLAPQ
jgi:hypothetical protein